MSIPPEISFVFKSARLRVGRGGLTRKTSESYQIAIFYTQTRHQIYYWGWKNTVIIFSCSRAVCCRIGTFCRCGIVLHDEEYGTYFSADCFIKYPYTASFFIYLNRELKIERVNNSISHK